MSTWILLIGWRGSLRRFHRASARVYCRIQKLHEGRLSKQQKLLRVRLAPLARRFSVDCYVKKFHVVFRGWKVKEGSFVAEQSGCTSVLRYTTTLVRRGSIMFSYQYDVEDSKSIFSFRVRTFVQNNLLCTIHK